MYIFGDSHTLSFTEWKDIHHIHYFSAASALGLINNKSVSKTGIKIKRILRDHDGSAICFKFGKVDMEWVYPYKKFHNSRHNIKKHIIDIVSKYIQYITCCIVEHDLDMDKIYVLGVEPPTLPSNRMIRKLNSERHAENITKKANIEPRIYNVEKLDTRIVRTKNILKFNDKLKHMAEKFGIHYLDITEDVLDKDTGILKENLCNPDNKQDHHLGKDINREMWKQKFLKENIFE